MFSPSDCLKLSHSGFVVLKDAVSLEVCHGLRNDILSSETNMARTGKNRTSGNHRTDHICWFDRQKSKPQGLLFDQLDLAQEMLNKNLFANLSFVEAMGARYEENGYYAPHQDVFTQNNTRVVSMVLYLNQHWAPQDGGCLRLHLDVEKGVDNNVIDIPPTLGTCVFFDSTITHEVLINYKTRFSVACWFHTAL